MNSEALDDESTPDSVEMPDELDGEGEVYPSGSSAGDEAEALMSMLTLTLMLIEALWSFMEELDVTELVGTLAMLLMLLLITPPVDDESPGPGLLVVLPPIELLESLPPVLEADVVLLIWLLEDIPPVELLDEVPPRGLEDMSPIGLLEDVPPMRLLEEAPPIELLVDVLPIGLLEVMPPIETVEVVLLMGMLDDVPPMPGDEDCWPALDEEVDMPALELDEVMAADEEVVLPILLMLRDDVVVVVVVVVTGSCVAASGGENRMAATWPVSEEVKALLAFLK